MLTPDQFSELPLPLQWRALQAMERLPSAATVTHDSVSRDDPRDFIVDVLGETPTPRMLAVGITTPWTPDQERVLIGVRDNRRVAVPSGHGSGKSYIVARLALWFLYRHEDSIVVTTAPTQRQVETVLWGEIRRAFEHSKTQLPGRLLPVEPLLTLGAKWQAIGFTTATRTRDISATAFQGLHAPYVMAIVDEAAGVDDQIRQGVEGITVRPEDRILAIGNPTDPTGWFVTGIRKRTWHVVHIDSRNHPNVVHNDPDIVPGAVSAQWIEERRDEYGEGSPLYAAKVVGLPPDQSQDALIQLSWVVAAQRKWQPDLADVKDDRRGVALGLDIASEGEDLTVLSAIRRGQWFLPELESRRPWHTGRNAIEAVDLLIEACRVMPVHAIALDDTGLGNVVRGRLLEIQREDHQKANGRLTYAVAGAKARRPVWILGVNFGAKSKVELYDLAKDELWWTLREALRKGELALPPEDVLEHYGLPRDCDVVGQITAPIYDTLGPGGSIRVHDKRDSKRAIEASRHLPKKSPDFAHSMALSEFAYRRLRAEAPKDEGKDLAPEELIERYYRGIIDRALGDQPKNGGNGNGNPAKSKPLPWQRGRFR